MTEFEDRLRAIFREDARRYTLRNVKMRRRPRAWTYGTRAVELMGAVAFALVVSLVILAARQQLASPQRTSNAAAFASPSVTPTASPSPTTPTLTPSTTPSASPMLCATGTGALQVCPDRGPVGTTVTLSGRDWGCTSGRAGFSVMLVFEGHPESGGGTEGGLSLPQIQPDSSGAFTASFVIPAALEPFRGQGGGPTLPGTYAFVGRPPDCMVQFVVTR